MPLISSCYLNSLDKARPTSFQGEPRQPQLAIQKTVPSLGHDHACPWVVANFVAKALHQHFQSEVVRISCQIAVSLEVHVLPNDARHDLVLELCEQTVEPCVEPASKLGMGKSFKAIAVAHHVRGMKDELIRAQELALEVAEPLRHLPFCVADVRDDAPEDEQGVLVINDLQAVVARFIQEQHFRRQKRQPPLVSRKIACSRAVWEEDADDPLETSGRSRTVRMSAIRPSGARYSWERWRPAGVLRKPGRQARPSCRSWKNCRRSADRS